jgi:hypothetical protein
LRISEAIEKTVTEPAKEVGAGVGKVLKGVGKVFGGLFGGGNKDPKQ